MKKGRHYLPVPRRGHRRLGALGLGLVAAISMVWQPSATVASHIDSEFGTATVKSATLSAIAPEPSANVASVDVKWQAAKRGDGTDYRVDPTYTVNWSATGNGAGTLAAATAVAVSHGTVGDIQFDASQNFTDVSAGATHACGIARGKVYCWGKSDYALGGASSPAPSPTVVAGLLKDKTATDVSAGTDLSCAIANSVAYCWGLGTDGQLGDNLHTSRSTPVAVSGLGTKKVTAISAGGTHACAVADGAAYCWGQNSSRQLGNNSTTRRYVATPVYVAGVLKGRTVAQISSGALHTCAVADGRAFCWGLGTDGRLGNGTTGYSAVPVLVTASGLLNTRTVTAISAGGSHSCAIADERAYCWGLGASGQLGNSAVLSSSIPVAVTTTGAMTGAATVISAGNLHTCAAAAGHVYCWGEGADNALGNNSTDSLSAPVLLAGTLADRSSRTLSAGTRFGCAAGNSAASCWGLGTSDQVGDGTAVTNSIPDNVKLTDKACPNGSVRIAGAGCSLLQGTKYTYQLSYKVGEWDSALSGSVAATTKVRSGVNPAADGTPARQALSIKWDAATEPGNAYQEYTVQRSSRSDHSDAATIAVTGTLKATDRGGVAPTRSFTAVSSGSAHSCAILETQLYCWGLNTDGQLGLGDYTQRLEPTLVTSFANKTVTAVSVGGFHTCAIVDTRPYCWGRSDYGQVGNGSTADQTTPALVFDLPVTGISAGLYHTCGIGNGDKVYCWGLGTSGQLGNGGGSSPTPVEARGALVGTTVTAVTAGSTHSCALASTGAAFCWGAGLNGKLGTGNANNAPYPVAVISNGALAGKTISRISAGGQHTCAIADSLGFCWGSDASGQLGNGTAGNSSSPVAVYPVLAGVTALSAGLSHSCAVATGKSYCWGENGSSQLGDSAITDRQSPVAPTAAGAAFRSAVVTDVGTGSSHTCAVADGDLNCWGLGSYGRLGNASTANSAAPVATISKARCGSAVSFGNGTCSLAPGTPYYYQVTYTLDGVTAATGSWQTVTTNP